MREVAKVKEIVETVYVSEDGKEFKSKQECLDYEKNQADNMDVHYAATVMYREDLQELVNLLWDYYDNDNYYTAEWFFVPNKSAWDMLLKALPLANINQYYGNEPKEYPCYVYGYNDYDGANFNEVGMEWRGTLAPLVFDKGLERVENFFDKFGYTVKLERK